MNTVQLKPSLIYSITASYCKRERDNYKIATIKIWQKIAHKDYLMPNNGINFSLICVSRHNWVHCLVQIRDYHGMEVISSAFSVGIILAIAQYWGI
jgi:hypothetical protein